ncbi:MAG TPA: flavin monoamine oxidase family protein [Rudaea sp.]|nr:flavin monoamine oxidase family protein [Rudaea sp.]
MRQVQNPLSVSRRDLLRTIGRSAGAAMMYQAMSTLGFARESDYGGPIELSGAPKGTSILILGAGMAGLVAAYELRRAGYSVKVLEYNHRAGGRSWTLRGGDEYTELGGHRQKCEFDPGLYVNPGPWRIPYHHHAMLDYARRLRVPLEPFNQINFNAYLHSSKAFDGKPQRYRHVYADYHGHVAELLSKAVNKGQLDAELTTEDKEKLLESLRTFGVLDKDYRYTKSFATSESRGYDSERGAGLMPPPRLSTPIGRDALIRPGLANYLVTPFDYDLTPSMVQPVGGMDRIAMALYHDVAPLVQLDAKVTAIEQDERGVSVAYVDARRGGPVRQAHADWCLCTIPLSILAEIPVKVGEPMLAAIQSAPYEASVKFGLQFKRRFWEEDERIYGGITYTDLPIQMIGYPVAGMNQGGKGVLLGGYVWGTNAYEFTAMTPEQRVRKAVEFGAKIHPQYPAEFENGISVAWHRSPFTQGCFANWPDAAREKHYNNLCQIDGRIALAGEHASRMPAWQEGAVLSSLDAISRMHQKIVATA